MSKNTREEAQGWARTGPDEPEDGVLAGPPIPRPGLRCSDFDRIETVGPPFGGWTRCQDPAIWQAGERLCCKRHKQQHVDRGVSATAFAPIPQDRIDEVYIQLDKLRAAVENPPNASPKLRALMAEHSAKPLIDEKLAALSTEELIKLVDDQRKMLQNSIGPRSIVEELMYAPPTGHTRTFANEKPIQIDLEDVTVADRALVTDFYKNACHAEWCEFDVYTLEYVAALSRMQGSSAAYAEVIEHLRASGESRWAERIQDWLDMRSAAQIEFRASQRSK